MRIKLSELRQIVRNVLSEAEDARTVSADLSPDEQELKSKYPNWGKGGNNFKQDNLVKVKAKQVANVLQRMGLTKDADNMKKVTQNLIPALEKMDQQELFVTDPEEIAQQFAAKFLKN